MWTQAEQEALERVTAAEYALDQARNELHTIMRREASRERTRRITSGDGPPDVKCEGETHHEETPSTPRSGVARVCGRASALVARVTRLLRWRRCAATTDV